jgi:hypothetical protein
MTSTLVVPRTRVERFRVPVVDVHSHPYVETPEAIAQWVRLLDQVNVRTSFILTGETGAVFRELMERYATAHPGRFLMLAGFDRTDPAAPDYGERLRRGLRADVKAGAVGLGELIDKGLGLVRAGDTPYFVDDSRFDPLWDDAGKLGVPVFVHIGEPTTTPCSPCTSPMCGSWRPRTSGSGPPTRSGGAATEWACPTAS